MEHCLKTLKTVERMTRTFKWISRLKKLMAVALVGYTVIRIGVLVTENLK